MSSLKNQLLEGKKQQQRRSEKEKEIDLLSHLEKKAQTRRRESSGQYRMRRVHHIPGKGHFAHGLVVQQRHAHTAISSLEKGEGRLNLHREEWTPSSPRKMKRLDKATPKFSNSMERRRRRVAIGKPPKGEMKNSPAKQKASKRDICKSTFLEG